MQDRMSTCGIVDRADEKGKVRRGVYRLPHTRPAANQRYGPQSLRVISFRPCSPADAQLSHHIKMSTPALQVVQALLTGQ